MFHEGSTDQRGDRNDESAQAAVQKRTLKKARKIEKKELKKTRRKNKKKKGRVESLKRIQEDAAGLDIAISEIWVCVPEGRDEPNVRSFKTFTADLCELAAWLAQWQRENRGDGIDGRYPVLLFPFSCKNAFPQAAFQEYSSQSNTHSAYAEKHRDDEFETWQCDKRHNRKNGNADYPSQGKETASNWPNSEIPGVFPARMKSRPSREITSRSMCSPRWSVGTRTFDILDSFPRSSAGTHAETLRRLVWTWTYRLLPCAPVISILALLQEQKRPWRIYRKRLFKMWFLETGRGSVLQAFPRWSVGTV